MTIPIDPEDRPRAFAICVIGWACIIGAVWLVYHTARALARLAFYASS